MKRYLAIMAILGSAGAQAATTYGDEDHPTCQSVFVYRLDKDESEQGGWVSKAGKIEVAARPNMRMHGPFGMTVCSKGDTTIEFWKP